jgi:hypothetical protein
LIPLTITAITAAYIIFVCVKSCSMSYPEAVMFRVFFLLIAPCALLVVF